MTREDVFPKLRAMIADSLAVDEAGVTLQSRLIDDLGADSLDFVDLVFAIEKAFGVKIREADLNFLARLDFSSPTVMKDGFLTAETLDTLLPLMPALGNVPDRARVTPGELFSLLTVESLCLMVERHLDGSRR
ncbi:MAG: acyl carrier protein [Acidobacteria bacterium]|nr:MAG: acyl carrier protein [Acidobacteriota bacterium]